MDDALGGIVVSRQAVAQDTSPRHSLLKSFVIILYFFLRAVAHMYICCIQFQDYPKENWGTLGMADVKHGNSNEAAEVLHMMSPALTERGGHGPFPRYLRSHTQLADFWDL
jgi:hypothetical protein